MLRKLKLYGELADFIGHKEFEIAADNLPKVMSFLVNNFEGIEQHMSDKFYQIKVGNYEVPFEELHYPIGAEEVHIVPVIEGSGGLGKVLAGVGLIALTVATGGFGGATIGTFGLGAGTIGVGKLAVGFGAMLALSGVSEMLFPMPKPREFSSEGDPRISFNFGGTQNTARAGTPVPVVYGEIITGSVVISGAIDTEQVQA